MRVVWTWIFAIAGLLALCVTSGLVGGALAKDMVPSAHQMTYTDFISVMLTAISVLLALLALIIAFVAVIGWNTINRGARRQVEQYLEKGFAPGKPLYLMIQQMMYEGIDRIDTELPDERGQGAPASRRGEEDE